MHAPKSMLRSRCMPVLGLFAVLACNKNVHGPSPAGAPSSPGTEPEPGVGSSPGSDSSAHPDLAARTTALVVEGGTYEVAPNFMVPQAWAACQTVDDCVALEGGCCDHCNGGFLTAVNGQYADQVQPYLERYGCEGSPECSSKTCDAPREHELACMAGACSIRDLEPEIRTIWKEHVGIPGVVAGGVPGGTHGDPEVLRPSGEPTSPRVSVEESIATVKKNSVYAPDCDRQRLARTQAARFRTMPGKTSVRFCVSGAGKTTKVETTREYAPDPEVTEVCRLLVKKWRFKPFRRGDETIEVCSEVTFDVRFD